MLLEETIHTDRLDVHAERKALSRKEHLQSLAARELAWRQFHICIHHASKLNGSLYQTINMSQS